jgi:hypothetical protein
VSRAITLVVGETYFSAFYADPERHHPIFQTLVYLGPDEDEPDTWHMFQRAESYHSEGSWSEMSKERRAEFVEPPVVSYESAHIDPIVNAEGLIEELAKWHSRIK